MCRRPVQIKSLRGLQGFVSMVVDVVVAVVVVDVAAAVDVVVAVAGAVVVAVAVVVAAAAVVDVLRCCCNHVVVDWGAIPLRLMTSML